MSLSKLDYSYKAKILVLGSEDSGKYTFCANNADYFSKSFKETIGVDIFIVDGVDPEGKKLSLSCWLCDPKNKFKSYHSSFFRGALGAFILFDITNKKSFLEVEEWKKSIRDYLGIIPIILIGNKLDLKNKRVIDFNIARKYADKERFVDYIEISAFNNINVIQSFEMMNNVIFYLRSLERKEFDDQMIVDSIKTKIKKTKN